MMMTSSSPKLHKHGVSRIVREFAQPFDAPAVAERCAKKRGVSAASLLKEWDNKARISIRRGKVIHSMIEHGHLQRWPLIANLLWGSLLVEYEKEVFDPEWSIKGIVDCLVYTSTGFYLYDWKTGKELEFESRYQRMRPPLDKYADTNGNHYQLQVGLYALMLPRVFGQELKGASLVHIGERDQVTEYPVDLQEWKANAEAALKHLSIITDYDKDLGF
jgi:hypothetical protein